MQEEDAVTTSTIDARLLAEMFFAGAANLEANKEWIKFADTKAIAFIAIIGVLFNFLYSIKDKFLCLSNYHIFKILYFASFVLLAISLLCSVYCLLPRTSKTDIVEKNVIYYKERECS